MFLPIRNKSLGFTLIELLVVISIILLVTGGGIAGFINFNDRQQVQTTVKDVQTLMRSAQVKARAGEGASGVTVAEGCVSPRKLYGYRASYNSSQRAVILYRVCNHPTLSSTNTERSRVTLGSNVNLTMSDVTFLALRGGVNTGGSDITVNISGQYSGIIYQFQVLQTGEITEGAFQ